MTVIARVQHVEPQILLTDRRKRSIVVLHTHRRDQPTAEPIELHAAILQQRHRLTQPKHPQIPDR
eukprot:gene19046-22397_t